MPNNESQWWRKHFEQHFAGTCQPFRLLHDAELEMDIADLIAEAERRKVKEIREKIKRVIGIVEPEAEIVRSALEAVLYFDCLKDE